MLSPPEPPPVSSCNSVSAGHTGGDIPFSPFLFACLKYPHTPGALCSDPEQILCSARAFCTKKTARNTESCSQVTPVPASLCSAALPEPAVLLLGKGRKGPEILRKVKALMGQGLFCIILLSPGRCCNNHVRHVLWSIKVTCLTFLFDVRQL